jgi:hypothetical protein
MKEPKNLALIGAAILFIGVFTPIVSVPIMGNINYFMNGRGDGVVIVVLALAAGALALADKVRHVVWPGAVSLAMLALTFYMFEKRMGEMRANMENELADNPFRGIAEMATNSVQLQWGWAVLVLGSALLIYAGLAARKQADGEQSG